MKLNNKNQKLFIISIYLIILFLGNGKIFNLFNVGTIVDYLIVLVPCILVFSILFDNRKNLKFKKIPLIFSILLFLWVCITAIFSIKFGIHNIKGIINFGVIIALANTIINLEIDDYAKGVIKKHIIIASSISIIYGIIQYIFGFGMHLYSNGKYPGMKGRIYSTFYIATLFDKYMVIVLCMIGYEMLKHSKSKLLKLMMLLSTIGITLTFSRSGLIVFLFVLFVLLILYLIKKQTSNILIVLLSFILILCIPGSKYSVQSGLDFVYSTLKVPTSLRVNLISGLGLAENDNNKNNVNDDNNDADGEQNNNDIINDIDNDQSLYFRDYYKSVGKQLAKEYPITGIGIGGYSYLYNNQNAKDYLSNDSVLFEDVRYMYPHSCYVQLAAEIGVLGLILTCLFILSLAFEKLKISFKERKIDELYILFVLIIAILVGFYTEILFYSKQYIYMFIIIYSLYCNNNIIPKKTNNKKISFLLLHLGYGGIESATINSANALSNKYDVELVSFYNLNNNQETKLNKNITIKYLYNGGPNKDEFINSVKNKKIISIFKEGFKAINILIKKRTLLIKYIKNCDAKYIVSTRVEFSSLLSEYGNNNSIKIAQEHHHHNNNKKYIKKLKNNYNRIDYLCALTTSLKEDYEKFLKNNGHTKIILLPNMLYDLPNKKTDLKNKNFISVSRLDEGKRIDEIIKIFSKIENKNSELYIIGDGKEFENLKTLVNELKLTKKVHMLGYLDKEEIEKYMLKSSVFLMTSISEGLPMVLLEAMSYGVPCIAYETDSGTSDIIDNNKNGYIIKNRNENEYIQYMNNLIIDDKKLKEFSNNSIKKSKEFSKEEILKIWDKILQ